MSTGLVAALGSFLFLTMAFSTVNAIKTRDRSNPKLPKFMPLSKSQAKVYNAKYNELDKAFRDVEKDDSKFEFYELLLKKKYFVENIMKDPEIKKLYSDDKPPISAIDLKDPTGLFKVLSKIQEYCKHPRPTPDNDYLYINFYQEFFKTKENLEENLESDIHKLKQKLKDIQKYQLGAYNDFYINRWT